MASKSLRIGIVMDPIESITPYKDSSLAMLLEAARRNAEIHYFQQRDLKLAGGRALGESTLLQVRDDNDDWYTLGATREVDLGDLDVVLMRKDPPFDMEYVYTTYILDRAGHAGAVIVNHPQALRDMNEKAYTAWFPQCCPDTLITRSIADQARTIRIPVSSMETFRRMAATSSRLSHTMGREPEPSSRSWRNSADSFARASGSRPAARA